MLPQEIELKAAGSGYMLLDEGQPVARLWLAGANTDELWGASALDGTFLGHASSPLHLAERYAKGEQ